MVNVLVDIICVMVAMIVMMVVTKTGIGVKVKVCFYLFGFLYLCSFESLFIQLSYG